MMRILIADDHAILRQGLKQILDDEFNDTQIGEADSAAETLQQLRKQPWDVLILDINMPGRSGLEVLHESRQHFSGVPVLVLSSTPEDQLALRVLKAGASGYMNKQAAPEQLIKAIREVMAGGSYVSATIAAKLVAELDRNREHPPHETLSDREFQVFRLLVTGKSVKEIATELSLSGKTISTFRSRIFEKLDVRNNVELVFYAQQHGLIESAPWIEPPSSQSS